LSNLFNDRSGLNAAGMSPAETMLFAAVFKEASGRVIEAGIDFKRVLDPLILSSLFRSKATLWLEMAPRMK
jgi:hypothetical protein